MIPIYQPEEAQKTILKRTAPDAYELSPRALERNLQIFGESLTPEAAVTRILHSVRVEGDAALYRWTQAIDGVVLDSLQVPEDEIKNALEQVDSVVIEAMRLAVERVRNFYQKQRDRLGDWQEDGLGQLIRPIQRVGVYVPGGTAPLPSSLIMSVVPAQVAGVEELVVCTPPGKDGHVPAVILAAAEICGISKVFRVGGAQAIGALAYGTQTIPAVAKIVGPGNLYVTLAKRQVFGIVGIDGLPGPTETMVIADENANPAFVAADLLAQAEHDVLASAILLTTSQSLANQVIVEIERQLTSLDRTGIIQQSLTTRGGIVIVESLALAFELANAYGAEHLCLAVEHPQDWIKEVKNAGGVFVGEHSFEVLGDYVAGPSHVMPTSGTARFASPLNVLDFMKITSVIALDAMSAAQISPAAATLAHAESLTAHAAAAEIRLKEAQHEQ